MKQLFRYDGWLINDHPFPGNSFVRCQNIKEIQTCRKSTYINLGLQSGGLMDALAEMLVSGIIWVTSHHVELNVYTEKRIINTLRAGLFIKF